MLIKESIWLKREIEKLGITKGDKILNFGSQSDNFYKYQPQILENIIKPTKNLGGIIINYDLFPGKGVDIYGNIFDDNVFTKLKEYKFKYIYLFNVLEHVEQKEELCLRIQKLLDLNGIILVSVPYSYPIHYDPIDNEFRPIPDEVYKLFPEFRSLKADIITDYAFGYYLISNNRYFLKYLIRLFTPFYKFQNWKTEVAKLPYLFKKFKVTVCIIQKF